jgi:hypothetical protein
MHLESRTSPLMHQFLSLVDLLYAHRESMFGRNLRCTISNPLRRPENQIFLLRPAKPSQLERLDAPLVTPEEIAALTELKSLVRLAWPTPIADCRLYLNGPNSAEAFLVNIYGEKSPLRPIDYFRPRTALTMIRRCYKLGGYCWHGFCWYGPRQAIEPFLNYCWQSSEIASPPTAMGNLDNETPGNL